MQQSDVVLPARLTAPPATILVVDDSPVNLQVLVRTLHGSGHHILAARNGRAALEIVQRARPDLILLDVMMPELDGFEVCRAVKSDPETADTAIIFLSALGDVSDKVSGLELGAVDYITKPIQAEEVLARVATHLTRQYLEREVRRSRDRLDRELASAANMQRLILPPAPPSHPLVGFAAFYRPSRHAGGDYYDVLELGDGRFGIVVADVSGHGAPAAIVMAMIRAVVHSSPAVADAPAAFLHHINRHFRYLWEMAMMTTAVYAVLDAGQRVLRIACAGHPPPLLVRGGASVAPLAVDAVLPLMFDELGDIPVAEHTLAPGDRLVFYTDGITDREAPDGMMFGDDRFRRAIEYIRSHDPAAIVASLTETLEQFASNHEPADDQTLLILGLR